MAACITRILQLEGFSAKLQTRDIKSAFSGFEDQYRIKWVDDTSLYFVFHEARNAKAFFLVMMSDLPSHILNPENPAAVVLSPYNGQDAQAIVARTEARSPNTATRSRTGSVNTHPTPTSRYTTPILPANIGPVSPAVSMMLLAAANGLVGNPGSYNYVTGIPHWNAHPINMSPHTQHASLNHKGSHSSLRSRGSQSSLHDTFAYGSGSGYSLGVGATGWMSSASSWTTSPQFATANMNDVVYQTNGASTHHTATAAPALPNSRSILEDIAEASSREELSFSKSSAGTPIKPSAATTIVFTNPTPESMEKKSQPLAAAKDGYIPVELPVGPKLETSASNQSSTTDGASTTDSNLSLQTPQEEMKVDPLKNFIAAFGQMGIKAVPSDAITGEAASGEETRDAEAAVKKSTSPPRIGLPGKRMLGAALGIRHPALGPRSIGGANANGVRAGAVAVGNS